MRLFAESNPHRRGKLFESVLNRFFASEGIPIRETFTLVGEEGPHSVQRLRPEPRVPYKGTGSAGRGQKSLLSFHALAVRACRGPLHMRRFIVPKIILSGLAQNPAQPSDERGGLGPARHVQPGETSSSARLRGLHRASTPALEGSSLCRKRRPPTESAHIARK